MEDTERLYIRLDFWDDAVGAFEPAKVLRQLKRAFPEVEIDPTDHQRVRLLRELEFWAQGEKTAERRETLVGQSWGLFKTNGPTYRRRKKVQDSFPLLRGSGSIEANSLCHARNVP